MPSVGKLVDFHLHLNNINGDSTIADREWCLYRGGLHQHAIFALSTLMG